MIRFFSTCVLLAAACCAAGQDKKRVTMPDIVVKPGELIVLDAAAAKGEVAFFYDAREFDGRHAMQFGKALILTTTKPGLYSVSTVMWDDRRIDTTLITVAGEVPPPPPPPPPPGPAGDMASLVIGVTDNLGQGRTLDQAAILMDQELQEWLASNRVSWRVIDVQQEAYRTFKLDAILARDGVKAPAAVAVMKDGSTRAIAAPRDANGVKAFVQGKARGRVRFAAEWNMHYFEQGGEKRWLTRKVATPKVLAMLAMVAAPFEEGLKLVPESQWRTINRKKLFPAAEWIFDQNGNGSCVGMGAARALRVARYNAGMKDQKLSPGCVYGQINGNRDEGAMIGDSLVALKTTGTCLYSTVREQPIYVRQFPAGWQQEAKRFRVEQAYICKNFAEQMSALQLGYVIVYGMQVGDNFEDFSKEGVAGFSFGVGNHCMGADGCAKLANGSWAFDNANSWGRTWGPWGDGRCYLAARHIDQADNSDCYAIMGGFEDPSEPTPSLINDDFRRRSTAAAGGADWLLSF